ncbi:hypothetical protein D3C87_1584520 [compost metagenome]
MTKKEPSLLIVKPLALTKTRVPSSYLLNSSSATLMAKPDSSSWIHTIEFAFCPAPDPTTKPHTTASLSMVFPFSAFSTNFEIVVFTGNPGISFTSSAGASFLQENKTPDVINIPNTIEQIFLINVLFEFIKSYQLNY